MKGIALALKAHLGAMQVFIPFVLPALQLAW